jgi:hypothetical protein
MTMRFRGSYEKVQKCVARTGFTGAWRELPNGHKQYRAWDGAVLNWWESSGTLNFQGKDHEGEFENAFLTAAEAKGRLVRKDTEPYKSSTQRIELRRRIERAQAVIAELEWRALREESDALKNQVVDKLEDAVRAIRPLL